MAKQNPQGIGSAAKTCASTIPGVVEAANAAAGRIFTTYALIPPISPSPSRLTYYRDKEEYAERIFILKRV